jgi:hypothetical protein
MRYSLSLVTVLVLVSCSLAQAPAKVTYQDHVLPIFREKCVGCHNPDKPRGGLQLDTYAKAMAGGGSGVVVKAGDPSGSRLFGMISHTVEPKMPPQSPKIPDASIETIRQWIVGGLLENSGSTPVAAKPTVDVGLKSVTRGKPEGPPPMPEKPLALDPVVKAARANAVTAIASNPWSPLVAVAGQKQVLLYNGDTLDLVGVLPFPEGVPHVLKFSRNGSLLIAGGGVGGKSGKVAVWSVKTGERIITVGEETDAVLAADISPDQTTIALGGPSKMIRLFSTKDGKMVREIKKHTDWLYALEFSPDGVLLASGDRNGGLFVWEAFTGREYFSLRGHTAAITAVSWRMDSNVLASASEDTTIKLWEMENGGNIKNWGAHGGGTLWVQYTHDGRIVSCGRDRVPKTWDGNGTAQRSFEATPDVTLKCCFSHDGGRVLAGDWTGLIKVWAAADGKPLGTLDANPPTFAERLDVATKDLAAKTATAQQLAGVATTSQAAATKATADLAAAQQAMATTSAAAKAAADAMPKAKAAADQANAALAAAQAPLAARQVVATAYAEAAAKVKAAAAAAPQDKELAAALTKAQGVAAQAAAELATQQKAVADTTAAAKTANDQYAAAQKIATDTAAAAAAAAKAVETLTPTVKPATDKAAADKAASDQAAAGAAAAKAVVDRLSAVAAAQPKK